MPDDIIARAEYAYRWGNGDALHLALVAELKTVRAELERLPSADDFHNAAQIILYWSEADNCEDTPDYIALIRGLAERMDRYGYVLDGKSDHD